MDKAFQDELNTFGNFLISKVKAAYDWQLKQFSQWLITQLTPEQFTFFGEIGRVMGDAATERWLSTILTITGRFKWDEQRVGVDFIPNIKPIFEAHERKTTERQQVSDRGHLRGQNFNIQEAFDNLSREHGEGC